MIPAGALAYVAIYLAAIVEGEVVFVAASVLVASGQLERWPVLISGALGAATGDQMYFYALRGRIAGWLTRFKPIAARQDAIARYSTAAIASQYRGVLEDALGRS